MTEALTLRNVFNPKKHPWLLAGFFFIMALSCGAWLLRGYSFAISPDGVDYISYGAALFDLSVSFHPAYYYTTLPYKLMHAITRSSVNPLPLIWLQITLGALAVGAMVYVISRKDVALAIGIGLILATDLLWGSQNRTILTEGPFVSLHVLALAWLISHYDHRFSVKTGELLLVGLFYGWTFVFRPANLLLVLCIPPLYFWLTRSWRKTAWVSAGIIILLVLIASFNFWRVGRFSIAGQSGIYVAFPLFAYHLFTADNGPVSQQLDQKLRTCMPELDYKDVTVNTSNMYIHSKFTSCLTKKFGYRYEEMTAQFASAYLEAIIHQPLAYMGRLVKESAKFLMSPVYTYLRSTLRTEGVTCDHFAWCPDVYVQHLSLDHPAITIFEQAGPYTRQLYLLPNFLSSSLTYEPDTRSTVLAIMGWLLMIVFLLATTEGSARFMVLLCIGLAHYMSGVVVAGHVFIPRYALPLSPFYGILSAATVVKLVHLVGLWAVRQVDSLVRTVGWHPLVFWGVSLLPALVFHLHSAALLPLGWTHTPLRLQEAQPTGFAYRLPLGTQWMSHTASRPSPARVLENGVPLPMPNAMHEAIQRMGQGRYSLWHGWLTLSTSDNSDPRTNGRHYTLYWPTPLHPSIPLGCYALVGVATLALGLVRARSLHTPWVLRLGSAVHMVGWRPLGLWSVSLLPALMFHLHSAALLPLGWTHTPLRLQKAQSTDFAYNLPLGTEWMSHTASRPSPARVLENGVPLPVPNAMHEEIQHLGQGRYSLWHGWLTLSTSDNSDPRTNGRQYVLYWPAPLPSSVPLGCYALVGVATLALGLVIARSLRLPWVLRLDSLVHALIVRVVHLVRSWMVWPVDSLVRIVGWRPLVFWAVSLLPALVFHLHSAALLPLGWTHTPLRLQEAQSTGFAYNLPLGTEWMSHTASRPSPARVLENGVPLAWPNAMHEAIQHLGQGRYSLWHGWLYLSTSDNSDPRTNGRHYTLYWPAPLPSSVPLGCYALVGVGTLALGLVRARSLHTPWVLRLGSAVRMVGWRPLVFWLVSLLCTLVLHLHSAALLPLGWMHTPLRLQKAQSTGFAYNLPLGTRWMSQTATSPSPAQVLENGVPLPVPNAVHEAIQHLGQGRYSLWHGWLYLSTSDNSDPRTNGRQYVLYWPIPLPLFLLPVCYGLAGIATLVLGLKLAMAVKQSTRTAPEGAGGHEHHYSTRG